MDVMRTVSRIDNKPSSPIFKKDNMNNSKRIAQICAEIQDLEYTEKMDIFARKHQIRMEINELKEELRDLYSENFEQYLS